MAQPPYSIDQIVNYLRAVNRADRRQYDQKPLTLTTLVDILYEARRLYYARTTGALFSANNGLGLNKYRQWLFEDAALGVNDTLGSTDERNAIIRNDYNAILYSDHEAVDCLYEAYQRYVLND